MTGDGNTGLSSTQLVSLAETTRRWQSHVETLPAVSQTWAQGIACTWPAGMRYDLNGVPSVVTEDLRGQHLTPWAPDAIAASAIRRMGPLRIISRPEMNLCRREFRHMMTAMFSIRGLYTHIINSMRVQHGMRAPEHFPFATSNLTMMHVAMWLFDHNLVLECPDVLSLEEYCSIALRELPDLAILTPRSLDQWIAPFEPLITTHSDKFHYPELAPYLTRDYVTSVEVQMDTRRRTSEAAPPQLPLDATIITPDGDLGAHSGTGTTVVPGPAAGSPPDTPGGQVTSGPSLPIHTPTDGDATEKMEVQE